MSIVIYFLLLPVVYLFSLWLIYQLATLHYRIEQGLTKRIRPLDFVPFLKKMEKSRYENMVAFNQLGYESDYDE